MKRKPANTEKSTQTLLQQYKASIKDISIEQPLHLYFFRPIAFVFVKLFYPFPLTPNQISFLSMTTGIAGGIFFFFKNVQEVVEKFNLPKAPNTFQEALVSLEKDHDFLTKDNVFPEELVKTWIKVKETLEIESLQKRPHPYEYDLYYDL